MEPNETQLANRYLAAEGVPTIDSSVLQPSQPEVTPVEPVDSPVPQIQPLEMTEPEKEVSAAQRRIMELNEQTVGESDFRTQQEQQQGIEEKTQAVTDLEARMKAITAEASAIPLQLQEEATGRGITKGGLAPLQTARLRTNAIQALTTQAQLEGARGNLSTAYDLVDRAVSAKYDPIREELNAKQANLNILLQSPELTLAEKNRANAQIQSINEQQAQIDRREEEDKKKEEVSILAAQQGADSMLLRAISNAQSIEEAISIANQNGISFGSDEIQTQITKLDNGETVLINTQTGEVIQNFGGVAPESLGGVSQTVEGWAELLSTGQATISNVPTNIRSSVVNYLSSSNIDIKKQLDNNAIKQITQTESALSSLEDLRGVVEDNLQFIGPISGLQRFNPWSDARKAQADVDRVRQTVGKALEGGVLRKEDEEKYKKILATLGDTPETALYKIDSLKSTLERDLRDYKQTQLSAGRYIDTKEDGGEVNIEELRAKYNY